ncbi:MAG TPA: HAD family hydrolase, partial [Anaerolineales bacterium]|nr:HAD family hydrolase [Anaerolineales bacterium]
MKILATDLDRTLLPNGKWPVDEQAITLFNEWTTKQGILVVYVTGRNLQLTEEAIAQYGVRFPNILCGDVGTTIRHYISGEWQVEQGWIDHVHTISPRWDNEAIREVLAGVKGMSEEE